MKTYKRKILFITSLILLMVITFLLYQYRSTNNTPQHRLQWWLESLNWNDDRLYNGKGVKIAVIDTGIDLTHPDLKNSILREYRVSELKPTNETNDFEHGTMVAGIISAFPSSNKGVLGIAPQAKILSIDVSDTKGIASIEALIEAIEFALSQNVDIINISMGLEGYSLELHNVIKKAYEEGVVIVAAAGNDIHGKILYPAKFGEVICVGSTSKRGDLLYEYDEESVELILLPGENIVTTFSSHEDNTENRYTSSTGTSISTPILSGIIALIMEMDDTVSNEYIKDYFLSKQKVIDIPSVLKDFKNK